MKTTQLENLFQPASAGGQKSYQRHSVIIQYRKRTCLIRFLRFGDHWSSWVAMFYSSRSLLSSSSAAQRNYTPKHSSRILGFQLHCLWKCLPCNSVLRTGPATLSSTSISSGNSSSGTVLVCASICFTSKPLGTWSPGTAFSGAGIGGG